MDAIEKRARELLARQYAGYPNEQYRIRHGSLTHYEVIHTMPAIIAALTPPKGYMLVPVELTDEMVRAVYPLHYFTHLGPELRENWRRMLNARPEVTYGS